MRSRHGGLWMVLNHVAPRHVTTLCFFNFHMLDVLYSVPYKSESLVFAASATRIPARANHARCGTLAMKPRASCLSGHLRRLRSAGRRAADEVSRQRTVARWLQRLQGKRMMPDPPHGNSKGIGSANASTRRPAASIHVRYRVKARPVVSATRTLVIRRDRTVICPPAAG